MWTNSHDLIDKIFDTDDVVLAQNLFDDFIAGKGDSLFINFSVSSLVDEVRDNLSRWVAKGNKRLDLLEHVKSGSVDSDESSVVDLSKSEQLEDLSDLRSKMVDTSDSDDENDLGLSRNIERVFCSSLSSLSDQASLLFSVGLVILFASLLVFSLSSSTSLSSLGDESLSAFSQFSVSGSLLKNGFGNTILLRFFCVHCSKFL